MRNNFRISLFICAVFLSSCTEMEKEKFNDFTEKKAQSVTERVVGELTPVDSLNILEEFNGQSFSDIKLNETFLFCKG